MLQLLTIEKLHDPGRLVVNTTANRRGMIAAVISAYLLFILIISYKPTSRHSAAAAPHHDTACVKQEICYRQIVIVVVNHN